MCDFRQGYTGVLSLWFEVAPVGVFGIGGLFCELKVGGFW